MTETIPVRTPAYHEDDLSPIPALVLLQSLWYGHLSPDQALSLRDEGVTQMIRGEPVSAFDTEFFSPGRFAATTAPSGRAFGL